MRQKRVMFLGGIYYLLPAIEVAHKHGYHVITVDNVPDNIAHQYSDEYHNVSIINKDDVLDLAQKLQIDGILSYGVDPGVTTVAYVAEKMNLPFQCSYQSARILQDKSLFRQFLSQNGFNTLIIEDYLDILGYQSTADCFTVDGKLAYVDYSDQIFDPHAANPFVPTMRIWPTTMEQSHQDELTKELQRLFTLLKCKTGIYNIETRICTNGKAYIMEVSPRAGGNRLAEIERIGTGIDLIEAEVCNAVNDPIKEIKMPHYDVCYMGYTLHSSAKGSYQSIEYEHDFKAQHFIDQSIYIHEGDFIEPLTGANKAIGDILLKFKDRDECDSYLPQLTNYIKIKLK